MWLRLLIASGICCLALKAHAPPTYLPSPPLRVRGNTLLDSKNVPFTLRGVQLPDLASATTYSLRIVQQRWNMNTVRLRASLPDWRDTSGYLDRVRDTIAAANAERLLVVLTLHDESGLPTEEAAQFWKECAAALRDNPAVIFDLYDQPRDPARDWTLWSQSMQPLIDAIRSTGAEQLIAAASFADPLDFQGIAPAHYLRDPSILYESHLTFDHARTDDERDANLGFLGARFPLYVGAWGMPFDEASPACNAVPTDPNLAVELLLQTLVYYDLKNISWTAASFHPGSLIRADTDLSATSLDLPWTCGVPSDAGMGGYLLLWMTGDPSGFGSIAPDQIASVAGGPALPIAPGQLVSLYGQFLGPETPVAGQLTDARTMPTTLADVRVSFDGIDAPVTLAGYFQVNVQVPYEVRNITNVQLFYRGVPSNRISVKVVDAAPGLLPANGRFGEAAVTNEDGIANSSAQPAAQGSIITTLATGLGETVPASQTGVAPAGPGAVPFLPVTLTIGGRPAEVLSVSTAFGVIGVMTIRARVPTGLRPDSARTPIIVSAGLFSSRPEVTLWIK